VSAIDHAHLQDRKRDQMRRITLGYAGFMQT